MFAADLFICKLCEEIYGNKDIYKHYLKRKHQTEKKQLQCHLCEYSTDNKGDLKIHHQTHTKEKKIICHLCGKRFGQKSNID